MLILNWAAICDYLEYWFTACSAQSWQYRDRRKPDARTMPYSYRITSLIIYGAQYHRPSCTLQGFEQILVL